MSDERIRGVLDSGTPAVGDPAPDFELPALIAGVRQPLRLSEYREKKSVVLAFYPFNWQQTTAAQLVSYQVQRPRVLAGNAEIVTITVDSIMNSTAWERVIGPFDFPMCSDFWPHGEVSERYGVFSKSGDDVGASERAVVIVNPAGRVAFRKKYGHNQEAPVEEVFTALKII